MMKGLKTHGVRTWVLLVAMTMVAGGVLSAQMPKIPGINAKPQKTAVASPEDSLKRLDDWQKLASETLTRLEGKSPPESILPIDADNMKREAEEILFGITSIRKENQALESARKATEEARNRSAEWSGFEGDPPYSVLKLDELEDEHDARLSKRDLLESSQSALEHLFKASLDDVQRAQSAIEQAARDVQAATDSQAEAAKWRLEAARQSERLLAVRSLYLRWRRDVVREKAAAAKVEIALLERMIKAARPKTRFLEEDVEQLRKVTEETEAALRKEMVELERRVKVLVEARRKLQAEEAKLVELPADSPEAALIRLRVAAADAKLESLRDVRDGVDAMLRLEKAARLMQQRRRELWNGVNGARRDEVVAELVSYADRFRDWANLIKIELETTQAEISNIEARKQSLTKEDSRMFLYEEMLKASGEDLAMYRRIAGAIEKQRRQLERWLRDFAPETREGGASLWHGVWMKLSGVVPAIWSFKVMSFESKVELGGEVIPVTMSVTVSMLVKALLFFCVGYWVATRIARRIRVGMVSRGIIGETQAKTLSTWAMLVVGFLLFIGTLMFLGIPLTMFAFLGGALAIGVGFGTQTLIKNFISGIILLFERKIRVGDIIDVDGIVGTVTEVNTRSSIIRSADDVETMVPNALFLENRVTNWTLTNARQRRSVRVGVAYGSETRRVMEILVECAGRHGLVCKDPAPFAVFEDFGDSALIFLLYFWYDFHAESNPMVVASDLRLMIEKRLSEAGIGVPFPQRDMHLTTSEPILVNLSRSDE